MFFGYALRIYRQLTAYSMLAPSVQLVCAVLIMRLAVVIIMIQNIPDCAVEVRSAFSKTLIFITADGSRLLTVQSNKHKYIQQMY